MKIAMGSDHAGFELKEAVKSQLEAEGHEVRGRRHLLAVSRLTTRHSRRRPPNSSPAGQAEKGVIVCGSGVGVSIVANKVDGIRAVNAHDPAEAEMSRRHNDANVVTLSGARLGPDDARPIVETFLATGFDGGRHERRVNEITEVEKGEL